METNVVEGVVKEVGLKNGELICRMHKIFVNSNHKTLIKYFLESSFTICDLFLMIYHSFHKKTRYVIKEFGIITESSNYSNSDPRNTKKPSEKVSLHRYAIFTMEEGKTLLF